jgi:hypothetical protein
MFHIGLSLNSDDRRPEVAGLTPFSDAVEYDAELDDVRSLVFEACQSLAESDAVAFRVEGFGQSPWPVDVATDLPTVIEQLPGLFGWLKSDAEHEFQLDFYEQGLERSLTFRRLGADVNITCTSQTDWEPSPQDELIERPRLEGMLDDLLRQFVTGVERLRPDIAGHAVFREWLAASPAS